MMIGWASNLFTLINSLATQTIRGSTFTDPGQCPAAGQIKSKPYTDPDLPPPYGEGYQYSASTHGKHWTGQTAATDDDYLAPEYALEAQSVSERNGKLYCDYGGKRLIKDGVVAAPYLRLSTPR